MPRTSAPTACSELSLIRIRPSAGDPRRGILVAGSLRLPCALGRSGVSARKREGDGASPRATLRPLALFYRPDRGPRPRSPLAPRPIRPGDGWCDDPAHSRYNQPVRLPFQGSHEAMWRADGLYDVVVDLDWNRRPAIRRRGSAIFMHVAQPGLRPTEGCIALPKATLLRLLARIGPRTRIVIGP